MNFIKLTLALVFISGQILADNPDDTPVDTIHLKEIEIVANRLVNFTTGAKIQLIPTEIKSSYSYSNLSELLAQNTTLGIKSYGVAGQSNVSLRGMHSKHTAVIWNGINLQSTTSGGFDMNSVPSFIIDDINLQCGGSGALFGSGAVGGIVHLNNNLQFNKGLKINYNQSFGSFNNFFEGLKFETSREKFVSSTRIYHKYGKNDFNFVNTQQFGKPEQTQQNAASEQYGLLQSNAFKINHKQKLVSNIWLQHHYLEIPPTMTNTTSESNQNTDFTRISLLWNYNGEIASWYSRVYYNYESLLYNDPLISLDSDLYNSSIVGEIENKLSVSNNILINSGFNYNYQQAKSDSYQEIKKRNRIAAFASIKYYTENHKFASVLSMREELIDNNLSPFTFSLSTRYFIIPQLNVNANISRTYNVVTFNDLYWQPGGNPDLKSEDGWSEDLGLNLDIPLGNHNIAFNISYFNINLNNHVIWLPTSGTYWSAENVESLWSRGVETALKYQFTFNRWRGETGIMYDFTRSTYESAENAEEESIGNQILYIPKHKGNAYINVYYKNFNLKYTHSYVGKRYLTKDNLQSIDPYQTANLSLAANFSLKKNDITVQFKINNIWNETYEVMAFYAMPLRYYSISLSYTFKNQPIN